MGTPETTASGDGLLSGKRDGAASVGVAAPRVLGWPEWIDQSEFRVRDGRDPLGLETITTDRIVPQLVPGILALSGRARYFSFHLFLLDEFARRKLDPSAENQSIFVRRREFEYGAAVLMCPRCGQTAAPVGAQSLRGIVRRAKTEIARGFSVDSELGGYGLYYSSPLRDLGLVHRRGTLLGEESLPIDVLSGARARAIASAFREAIKDTVYFRRYFMGDKPIPLDVLRDYGERGCLCRLTESVKEVALLRSAMFDEVAGLQQGDVHRRREAFGVRLRLAYDNPRVLLDEAAFRRTTVGSLDSVSGEKTAWAQTVQRWAALYTKEYYQEGLRALWADVNRHGRAHCPVEGLPPAAFLQEYGERIPSGTLDIAGVSFPIERSDKTSDIIVRMRKTLARIALEDVRGWAVATGTAIAGMLLLMLVVDRLPVGERAPIDAAWLQVAREGGNNQPGLFGFAAQVRQHLADHPTVEATILWLVRRFVLAAHDRIAAGKLPDFTFRFRLEAGRLRFFTQPSVDFGLADSRFSALSSLSADLGLWRNTSGTPAVTPEGDAVVQMAFG